MSDDIAYLPKHPVPLMSAEAAPAGNDARGAIDALADRVDMLASIVRETAGSISASRGDVASLDRRVQERIGEDTKRSAAALTSLRGELDALRAFVEQAPDRSVTVSAAASDPLNETVATLTERVETLAEIIRSTAGQLVAEQSRISILLRRSRRATSGSRRRSPRSNVTCGSCRNRRPRPRRRPPRRPRRPSIPGRWQFEHQVGALAERVDFLSGTVAATAGKLAVTDGELAKAEQHSRQEADARVRSFVRCVRIWRR